MIKAIETSYKGYRFRSAQPPIDPKKKLADASDLSGARFGRLVVESDLGVAGSGYRWWGCVCDCGQRVAVRSRELRRGHTQSCGCLQREAQAASGGRNRLPRGHASRNELLASYQKSASSRGLAWELTDDQFFSIVAEPCTYCGTPASSVRKPNAGVNGEFLYSGLDRLDNATGYELENVVPCCWICNRAKGALSINEFEAWIDRLVAAQSGAKR